MEAWCNLSGRYVHVIADLSGQGSNNFTQSICNLGVMGTEYKRKRPVPSYYIYTLSQDKDLQK